MADMDFNVGLQLDTYCCSVSSDEVDTWISDLVVEVRLKSCCCSVGNVEKEPDDGATAVDFSSGQWDTGCGSVGSDAETRVDATAVDLSSRLWETGCC